MRIVVASGKGGTGKTTVATSLAWMLGERGEAVTLADCDVEEPNAHIFLKPRFGETDPVTVLVPTVDESKCTACGLCSEICRYNAIACVRDEVLIFPELCHGCGGCALVCPEEAIHETERQVGVVECGSANGVGFVHGRLSVGEAMATPVVRAVKRRLPKQGMVVIDAPPGTSCPVVATLNGADHAVLVTEPTPFGLSDLGLAVGVVRKLGVPFCVVINRCDVGDDRVTRYCREEGIEILTQIPDDRDVAVAYARGKIASSTVSGFAGSMEELLGALLTTCQER